MSASISIPHPSVVQKALRTTTERLAHELGRPTETAPTWSEFEWRAARAAAAIHCVGPLLATSLRWEGPPAWQAFIREQREHTQRRHERIEHLARLIDERARERGLPLVALKGAALHALGFYRAGERPMADLDLLVRESDLPAAARLLEEQNYVEKLRIWRNHVFTPSVARPAGGLGEHRDSDIKIELHWRISERLPAELTDVSERVFPSSPRPGLNPYPSLAALLMHLVLHAAGSMVSRDLRLVHLNDLALVCARMTSEDWKEVLHRDRSVHGPWWLLPPLRLASRYYPEILLPRTVLASLERGCPRPLSLLTARKSLTDVSLSSVWIQAFPGIEWSRSLGEGIRYVMRRMRLDADARAIKETDAVSAPWTANDPWSDLSHRSRILRWMISRPTRPAAMYTVREALR
jgi:Uncharacterised nucleotidyltransferase